MLPFVYQNGGVARERHVAGGDGAVNFYVGLIKNGLAADARPARRGLVR